MKKYILAAALVFGMVSTVQAADARHCIRIGTIDAHDGSVARQSITNICTEKIGLVYCHEASSQPGTKGTECGHNDRYYQQFTSMEGGQVNDNQFSMPNDATIRYGACFGGEGKVKKGQNGDYSCR